MSFRAVCLVLLAASVALHAAAVAALARHRRKARGVSRPGFSPAVSVVKPLAGLDAELRENLRSFFEQDYPDFELVFSFASESDPAFAVARAVADEHPGVPATFVVDAREPGLNAKVNRLSAGLRRAKGRILVFSDGDVRVPRDYLARAVSWFADERVGLVSHLFRSVEPRTVGARLEASYLDGVLRPATAAFAQILGRPCVVGKSIVLSRAALIAVGGMAPLRDFLAEDFLLGRRVREAGYGVVLSADEIEAVAGRKTIRSVWSRHRRWGILRRRLGGPAYALESLAGSSVFAAGALLSSEGDPKAIGLALGLWAARVALEARALRGARPALSIRDWLWFPIRDAGLLALFFAGLFGSRTRWRGRELVVGPGTILDPAAGEPNDLRIESA